LTRGCNGPHPRFVRIAADEPQGRSLYRPGAHLILDAIRRLERGESVTGTPQYPSAGAYYTFPTEDDLIRVTALGWRLFDREDVWELLESYPGATKQ